MYSNSSILSILYGTWSLINITSLTNGTLQNSTTNGVGTQPSGLLQYLPNGYMSANLMANEASFRPLDIEWPSKDNDSDSDWTMVGKHTLSYAGLFSIADIVSEVKGLMMHGPMKMASVPKWVDSVQKRNFTFWEGGEGGEVGGVGTLLQIGNDKCFYCGLWWRKVSSIA